jgi:putative flippase GtrA
LLRFLIVGATGLVVNNAALFLVTEGAGIYFLVSAAVATQFSTLWNFSFTELWVFSDRGQAGTRTNRLLRFLLMNNLSLALRGPVLAALVSRIGMHYVAANLISLLAIAMLRFALSDRWIWTSPLAAGDDEAHHYDIHGTIAVTSGIRLPELEHFRVPLLDRPPDIRLRQERRRRMRTDDRTIHYHDGLGRHGFEISITLAECTEVQVSPLVRRSPHVLYTNVFEPILRWTFARKGYALVHGGCISTDRSAVLITARTDTGKTTTILRAIRNHRYGFLSDDMTILGRDGEVLSFPKPLTISAHTLGAIQYTGLNLREWLALQLQSRIHSRPGRRFALWLSKSGLPASTINALAQILVPPPKYVIERLIPEAEVQSRGKLSHVVLIEHGQESVNALSQEAIVDHLIQNGEDAYGFPPYPELADSLSTWQGRDLHAREREIIGQAVRGKSAVHMRNPAYGWWERLPEIQRTHTNGSKPRPRVRIAVRVSEADIKTGGV